MNEPDAKRVTEQSLHQSFRVPVQVKILILVEKINQTRRVDKEDKLMNKTCMKQNNNIVRIRKNVKILLEGDVIPHYNVKISQKGRDYIL